MEKEFIDGLIVKRPHERAPQFVKAAMSIKVDELIQWLQNRNSEWVNIDIKEARSGKYYAQLNTYKPKEKREQAANMPNDAPFEDSIPF